MDKRTVIALVLITIIILTLPYYQRMVGGDQPVEPREAVQRDTVYQKKEIIPPVRSEKKVAAIKQDNIIATPAAEAEPFETKSANQDSIERTVVIESEKIYAEISNKGGGTFKKFILKNYDKFDSLKVNMIDPTINNNLHLSFQDVEGNHVDTDNYFFYQASSLRNITLENGKSYKVEYSLPYKNGEIKKTLVFYDNSYHVDLVVNYSNPDQILLNRRYQVGWKNGLPSTEAYASDDMTYNQAYVYMGDELESYDVSDEGKKETETFSGKADWVGIRTKYFVGSISNINSDVSDGIYFSGRGIKNKKEDYIQRLYDTGYYARFINDQFGDSLRVYLGPLDNHELEKYNNNLDILIMNNGWYESTFRFLTVPVLPVLEFLYGLIPNYGIVIIIFSIIVKLLVYPLTKKSYTSMKEMQKVQPLLAGLKEKYKSDPQRLNKETMKLYKEHGVNPLGGCLPMLLQFPFLISLFIVFRSTIQLRGAEFIPGWVTDLSQPDTLFLLPFSIPFYGDQFNLLPILMAVTMIFQSKMTMQDPKQKAMVYMMPIFMLLLFNRFPSGLNLYYTLFNLWSIIQQKFINKGIDDGPVPVKVKTKKNNKK